MENKINVNKTGEQLVIQPTGSIDEDRNFPTDVFGGVKAVMIDFSQVTAINSCGIREWIRWLSPHQQLKITYKNCPKIIVDQINMVDGFLPEGAAVESFYVPYYCDESGEEKHILFSQGKEFSDGKLTPPAKVVDSKNQDMEMDVIESKYFRFLHKKTK